MTFDPDGEMGVKGSKETHAAVVTKEIQCKKRETLEDQR